MAGEHRVAMIQVLGAVAYGEHKAYEEADAKAHTARNETERREWRKTAAEELRHHKGFVRRLRDLGADPDRAMRPYRASLDRYHASTPRNEVEEAVWSYLGEGVADDLLRWLRQVADPDTAAFVDTVLADEETHEARATKELRRLLSEDPARRPEAMRAALRMLGQMALSGGRGGPSLLRFGAFLRVGQAGDLLAHLADGYRRRLREIGIGAAHLLPVQVPLRRAQ